MTCLTLENLLELHVLVVQETGGSAGLRDLGRLESVIASQTQQAYGKDLYDTTTLKAAAIIRGIIADHPFIDGNKRTAMLAGLTFLHLNDLEFTAQPGEIEDFAVKIAVDHLAIQDIDAWLRQHLAN